MSSKIIAVVPAAGVGSRMMAGLPKQYLSLNERYIIDLTIDKLLAVPSVSEVVVAVSSQDEWWPKTDAANNPRVHVTHGGPDRSVSVKMALAYCQKTLVAKEASAWALVHDAARPCVDPNIIETLIARALVLPEEARNDGKTIADWHVQGAILASPVSDTVKRVSQNHVITATEDRSELWLAHTPQLFPLSYLLEALDYCHKHQILVTDEASAVEATGGKVLAVKDRRDNIKITYAEDLVWAEQILSRK